MKIPLVNLYQEYLGIKNEIDLAIEESIKKSDFSSGSEVEKLEKDFSNFIGTKYAIATGSGMDALNLIACNLNIQKGDEVITVSNTFIATILPFIHLGAVPVFADIDPKTSNINPDQIEKLITKKTKAILPVHLYGYPAAMDELIKIADKHNIPIIEDACQAHGATLNGKKCGSFGLMSAFSFYPTKNLGAFGEAGIVVTDNKKIADKAKVLRNVGQSKKYHHDLLGYNNRMDTIQAAILRVKLKHLNKWNQRRRQIAILYSKNLTDQVIKPFEEKNTKPSYYVYTIETPKRDNLLDYLKSKNIHCGIYYPLPLHLQKSLKNVPFKAKSLEVTEKKAKTILSLPIYPSLSDEQVEYVIKSVNNFFK